MPAVPEVIDIAADKRPVEVVRNLDSEQISGTHSHQTVSCEIEEQVEAVGVIVNQHAGHILLHAVLLHQEIQHRGDHGFVHHAQQDFVKPCSRQIQVFRPRDFPVQVLAEPAAPVDGARGDGREEQKQVRVFKGTDFLDDSVVDLDDHLCNLEGHVGDSQKSENMPGISRQCQHLVCRQRRNAQQQEQPVQDFASVSAESELQIDLYDGILQQAENDQVCQRDGVVPQRQPEEHQRSEHAVVFNGFFKDAQNESRDRHHYQPREEAVIGKHLHFTTSPPAAFGPVCRCRSSGTFLRSGSFSVPCKRGRVL